ncbi:hypothetical protein TcCL_NonESM00979 [Trypanosoma cruzi]|nr:hypothetical protein TcCL_NonESM00979 [Trypanosoma cruzi]
MGQCSANRLPSSAAQLLQTAVCFFLFREARMDSGFLGAVMAATECRNEVQFIPLSWPRLATSPPPANGENAAHVVAQWRAGRWAKTKCRWTHNLRECGCGRVCLVNAIRAMNPPINLSLNEYALR